MCKKEAVAVAVAAYIEYSKPIARDNPFPTTIECVRSTQAKEGRSRGLWTRRVVLSDEGSICLHLEEQSVVSEVVAVEPFALQHYLTYSLKVNTHS